ncbi:MAG: hypothetical protein KatS3mg015_0364 [Fimbriimonadales bacterium]|nr:MAG: hypothetical protein KatS3mg015_0364 [Fimbriimonadales bacterium]
MSRRYLALIPLVAILAACGKSSDVELPTYVLLLPESDAEWAQEIEQGFRAGAEQFFMEFKVIRYRLDAEPGDIVESAVRAGAGPIVAVAPNSELAHTIPLACSRRKLPIVLIGHEDPAGARNALITSAATNLAYMWKIRWRQLSPPPKNVLLLFGDSPLDRDELISAFYQRSNEWRDYKLRVRDLGSATAEDFEWATAVVPVGEDATKSALERPPSVAVLPLDGSRASLQALQSGRVPILFAPRYFQLGYRAARVARDVFLRVRTTSVTVRVPFEEVDAEYLPVYEKKRYEIPSLGGDSSE